MRRQDLSNPPTAAHKRHGQALVEFALTILTFLLLLVMIIEVGRILWAYVTLQHAARSGARYAVTGQWEENYAIDADAHFDPSSPDPLAHIPPCWPRFGDDPLAPTVIAYDAYEPYRNARTCSVEATALRQMRPLPLDPSAAPGQPGFYRVRVTGVAKDIYPTSGTFYRQSPTTIYSYSSYFTDASHAGDNFGWSPGYGGRPEGTVAVRAEHRLPIITPLLNRIAPSIMLRATAIMTNEAYGSTGVQREAILPPELPPMAPFDPILPPDLVIDEVTFSGDPNNVETGAPQPFTVRVSNIGDIVAAPDDPLLPGFVVRLYAVPHGQTPGALPWTGDIGESGPVAPLMPGTPVDVPVSATFPVEGQYDVWAWVDAADASATGLVDEVGTGEEQNPLGETNNIKMFGPTVLVGDLVDLWITKSASPNTPNLDADFTYHFDYGNNGLSDATNVTITDNLPAGITFVSGPCSGSTTITCNVGTVAKEGGAGSIDVTVRATSTALDGVVTPNTASISPGGGETEMNPSDNTSTANIVVHGVDVSITATVDNAEPLPEDTVTFTATVTNSSTNTATNVPVRITLDDGINATNFSPSTGSYDPGTGVWTISNLTNGSPATITVRATVEPTTEPLEAAFEVQGTTPTNVGEDILAVVVLHVQQSDLQVTKQVDPAIVAVTEDVVYTLRVTNAGPDDATGVRVIDVLPAELRYESHAGDGAASFNAGARRITWDVGNLAAGASATLTINTELLPTPVGTNVTNAIAPEDVTLDQFDPTPGNNQPSVNFLVSEKADLALTGIVSVDGKQAGDRAAATIGQEVVVRLTVTNNGPSDATGVVVTGAVPPGLIAALQNLSMSGDVNASTGDWTVGALPRGESVTLTVTGIVRDRSTRTAYMSTARATLAEPAVDLLQDNNTFPLHIILSDTLADLTLVVIPASQEVRFGTEVSYTVRVTNNGPTNATNVNITLEDFVSLHPAVLNITGVSRSPSSGTSYDSNTGRWTVNRLNSGQSAQITITGTVEDQSVFLHGVRNYPGVVAVESLSQWDPDHPSETNWELVILPPLPFYYNIGSNQCSDMIWGDPSGGLVNGHPLIGRDVVWTGLAVTNGTRNNNVEVYAPTDPNYSSGGGRTQIGGNDAFLFRCYVQRSGSTNPAFTINNLRPGLYRVTLLLYEPHSSQTPSFTVDVNGVRLFNNSIYQANGGLHQTYYITQGGPVTVGSNGRLNVQASRDGKISGIGLEYLGAAD